MKKKISKIWGIGLVLVLLVSLFGFVAPVSPASASTLKWGAETIPTDVDKVILAGAFGSYIDKESAMIMGLFPDCELEDVYAVGNAAGDGARIALLNRDKRVEANQIARQVEYVELTVEGDFEREFAYAMYFPHMKDEFPHLKDLLRETMSKS